MKSYKSWYGDKKNNVFDNCYSKDEIFNPIVFQPTMSRLMRIIQTINESGSIGKTSISRLANLNYSRLLRHISWLEEKGFIQSIICNGKIQFTLTSDGKNFAEIISF